MKIQMTLNGRRIVVERCPVVFGVFCHNASPVRVNTRVERLTVLVNEVDHRRESRPERFVALLTNAVIGYLEAIHLLGD